MSTETASAAKTGTSVERERLREMFRIARTIAVCDDRMHKEVRAGTIKAATYPVRGMEGVCAAIGAAAETSDYLVSTYRNLGDVIAKGIPLGAVIAEMSGKRTGVAKGKGGSMHMADTSVGFMTTTGIVGSGLPIANGLALASQMSGDGKVTIVTFGDGATSIGAFHEALNLAALWKLPIVFVCQNNGWAEHTPVEEYMAQSDLLVKANAYGIAAERVDGFDAVLSYEAIARAIAEARDGAGPRFIEAVTYRLTGHTALADFSYMDRSRLEQHKADDAVIRLSTSVREFDGERTVARVEADVDALVDEAFAFAIQSAEPDPDEVSDDVYAAGTVAPEVAQ
jgi:TPP-dependent pyruvate/acetoin dehydrogenase alpha subunit